jgi:hypothetical protein
MVPSQGKALEHGSMAKNKKKKNFSGSETGRTKAGANKRGAIRPLFHASLIFAILEKAL